MTLVFDQETTETLNKLAGDNHLEMLKVVLSLKETNKVHLVNMKSIDTTKILVNWETAIAHATKVKFWHKKRVVTVPIRSYFDKATGEHLYSMFGKECYVGSLIEALKKISDKINEYLGKDITGFSSINFRLYSKKYKHK